MYAYVYTSNPEMSHTTHTVLTTNTLHNDYILTHTAPHRHTFRCIMTACLIQNTHIGNRFVLHIHTRCVFVSLFCFLLVYSKEERAKQSFLFYNTTLKLNKIPFSKSFKLTNPWFVVFVFLSLFEMENKKKEI